MGSLYLVALAPSQCQIGVKQHVQASNWQGHHVFFKADNDDILGKLQVVLVLNSSS